MRHEMFSSETFLSICVQWVGWSDDPAVARFLNPQTYPVGLELGLAELRSRLAREERAGSARRPA